MITHVNTPMVTQSGNALHNVVFETADKSRTYVMHWPDWDLCDKTRNSTCGKYSRMWYDVHFSIKGFDMVVRKTALQVQGGLSAVSFYGADIGSVGRAKRQVAVDHGR